MSAIARLFALAVWIGGIVIAKGFWSTVFAVFVPFWAWYLVVEKALRALGWL